MTTAIRKIADKLGKPRVAIAVPGPPEEHDFDLAFESSEAISRYPTISFVCLMAGIGLVLVLAAATLLALLIVAFA